MSESIKPGVNEYRTITTIDSLPDFDAVQFLDSEDAIAAYLADIAQAGDDGLLAMARGDITRARHG